MTLLTEIHYQLFGQIQLNDQSRNAILNRDADRPNEAILHVYDDVSPPIAARVLLTEEPDGSLAIKPQCLFRDAKHGLLIAPELSNEEREQFFSLSAHLKRTDKKLEGEIHDRSGTRGRLSLNLRMDVLHAKTEQCADWAAFKSWADKVRRESNAAAYRGMGSNRFRLRTSFHRANRYRLERYCLETLPEFSRNAEAVLGTRIDMNDTADYAMLLGLAQHHGLPTPLLDWTKSPYIAAFFAFADAIESSESRPDHTHVRIYAMTQSFIERTSPPTVRLPLIRPYVFSLQVSPHNNPRLYAQQGHFLVTSIEDIESFVCTIERLANTNILFAADVPISCAGEALEDLAFMGLTAATMFPGLDGVGRMIRHKLLFRQPQHSATSTQAGTAFFPPTVSLEESSG